MNSNNDALTELAFSGNAILGYIPNFGALQNWNGYSLQDFISGGTGANCVN